MGHAGDRCRDRQANHTPRKGTLMASARQPQKVLLVVEDNDVAGEWLVVLLGREGYRVVPAANGEQALNYLRTGPTPDLILLDMLMPVLDGWHFLKRWRQDGQGPAVPVVITTGTIL